MATILVVDDEFGISELLEALLTDEGHRVLTAANGRQALERMGEARPDLVISDLMMPVMDGATLLRMMRESPEWRDIPFVLMCALPEDHVRDRLVGPYQGFMRKPFRMDDVVDFVDRLLQARGAGRA
ncbi:MAG: response regulator [Rhodospirillales bacterium]|nr:response regulator [Rhodospirillales bacterium]